MSDEELEKIGQHMVELYGDKLPDPEHSPMVFDYFVKMYKFYHMRNENVSN